MLPSNRQELIEELDATDEKYVKKKFALGGYQGWQARVVDHWLSERATARQEAAARASSNWLRLRVGVAACGLIVTIIWHFIMR